MSELRKEFERIIEDTSDGLHDSRWWWDEDFADNGVTIIDGLCERLEHAALASKPSLPRVSPEDLVEGKWYVVRESVRETPDWDEILKAGVAPKWKGGGLGFSIGYTTESPDDWIMPRDCHAVWGPINYELEEA